jgi:hypothetical protein
MGFAKRRVSSLHLVLRPPLPCPAVEFSAPTRSPCRRKPFFVPGLRARHGATRDAVGSQVDVVPTIMGRPGGMTRHQCWGRDLLNLPEGDAGFAVFKPSGGDQIVALASGDRLLVKRRQEKARLYACRLGGQGWS